MLKEVYAPSLKRNVKFGRRQEIAPCPTFKFHNYALVGLPDEPATLDYTAPNGSTSAALADIYGNDVLGDCVIAWLFHQLALWTGNATGTAFRATLAQIKAMYGSIGGYIDGNPSTDNGCDPATACNWIVANGFPNSDKPVGWLRVDATNKKQLRQAVWLFEGCGFGVGLPDARVQNMPSSNGFVWDVAGPTDPNNGHMFMGGGYNDQGVVIDTWGLFGVYTYAAIAAEATAQSGGEIDILLSPDMIAKAALKAPNGFDWAALVSDFDSIGGTIPVPAPPSPPSPTPSGPVTLAQAQAWAAAGINAGHPLMTRAQAVAAANAGLAKGFGQS